MLRGTPFHTRTAPLNQTQSWRRWAGCLAAGSYELSPEREYWAVRNSAALFDISPLYKYLITGPDAARLLNRVVTRDVGRCAVGQVLYTPWCDAAGKVLDDGTLARLDEQTYRLTAADPNLRWLSQNAAGLQVTITDISASTAALALQGPFSREILAQIAPPEVRQLKYFRLIQTTVGGVPAAVSRTGYTGDLGYEIWTEAGHAERLWDALLAAGRPYGLAPAGILALDIARVEAGLLLLEVDYQSARHALIEAQKSSPYELGLGWAVALDKGGFVGRAALQAEQARGPAWQFVGLAVEWDNLERLYAAEGLPPQLPAVTQRTSVPVAALGQQVGYATSLVWSPLLKQFIALAHLESARAQPDSLVMLEVTVQHHRRYTPARVVKLPFFDPERKRQ
ncbi:MAG: aminomethyltransferase family protein [Anaerolineales bacterium]|nr:aminomethyltransferase family protein [Anaerolineales bacterium]